MNESYDDYRHRKTMRRFIHTKSKKLRNIFIYKKLANFRSAFYIQKPNTWRYRIFMNFFRFSFIYKKDDTFRYLPFFIYKKLDTSKKARQFAIRFYIQKSGILRYAIFIENFEIFPRGKTFIDKKTMYFGWKFSIEKTMQFTLRFYIQRAWHYVLYFNIQKTIYFSFRFYIYNLSCSPDT